MSVVRELRTKFTAEVRGIQKAFRTLSDEASKLAPSTKKTTDQVNKSYGTIVDSTEKLQKAISKVDDDNSFDGLNQAINKTQSELKETGNISEEAMKELKKAVSDSKGSFDDLGDDAKREMQAVENAIEELGKEFNNLDDSADLGKAAKSADKLGDEVKGAGRHVDDLTDEFDDLGDTAEKETGVAGGAIEKFGKKALGLAAVIGGAFAVDKIKDFGLGWVETTAELGAVRDQYEQVMGSMVASTDKYLNQMSERWNKHPDELQSTLMQYVAILKGKGIAEKEAHKIARQYLERTVDANAFANEDMADTTARFMGMIKGEYDSVDTAMVNVNATMLDTKAQKEYGKKFAELSAEQQELLKIQEALRQHTSAGVVGQGAREADSYNNNLAMLRNTWNEFLSDYGGPAMNIANNGLKSAIGIVKNLGGTVSSAKEKVAPFFKFLKDIGSLFQGNDGRDISILGFLGLSADEIKMVMDRANLIKKTLSLIRGGFDAFIAFMQGNEGKAISIMSLVGMDKDQITNMLGIFGRIKDGLTDIKDFAVRFVKVMIGYYAKIYEELASIFKELAPIVKPLVEDVFSFIQGVIKKLIDFWNSDGQQFVQAIANAFKVIGAIVKFVMPLVLAIIKSVWGNIKGVITGALDIIMGVIKIFSGLFTGDFKKMWEGVKQLFKGAIQFVWNFIQLTFFGKILKGAKAFILSFKAGLASMWQGVKSLFSGGIKNAWNLIKTGWNMILNATKSVFTNIWTFIKNTFQTIKNIVTGAITIVKTIFSKGWNFIKNFTRTSFSNIWNTIKNIFNNVKSFIGGAVNTIRTKISNTWKSIKDNTVSAFKNIFNAIKNRFNDIVNAAKGLPKKIGDGIGKMASKVKGGVTKVINSLASTLGKGVNGVIGGINWALDKVGVSKKNQLSKWPVPQWAHGTKNGKHPGGPMIVGDGKGTNRGPELIKTPDGKEYLSPDKPTFTTAPKGTMVWSATDTRDILGEVPMYAKGTFNKGISTAKNYLKSKNYFKDKMVSGAKRVKETGKTLGRVKKKVKSKFFDVFDYLRNPNKLLEIALRATGAFVPDRKGFIGKFAAGAFNKVKGKAVSYIKNKLKEFGGGSPSGFGSNFGWSSSYGWRTHPISGKRKFHYGADMPAAMGTPIPAQVGGLVTSAGFHPIRGNYVRIKSGNYERIYQHNIRNAVRSVDTVKKGQIIGYVGSTGSSTGPHLHYEVLKNGLHINPKGYADGGIVDKKQLAWIAEGGWAESIISHDPAKRNSQQAIWEKTGKELGFMNNGDNQAVVSLLIRIANAVEKGSDLKVLMNDRVVGRILEPVISELQTEKDNLGNMMRG